MKGYFLVFIAWGYLLGSSCDTSCIWQYDRSIAIAGTQPLGLAIHDDTLWVADAAGNKVVASTIEGDALFTIENLQRPMHLASYRNGVIVPEFGRDSISVIQNGQLSAFVVNDSLDAPAAVDHENDMVGIADFYNHSILLIKNGAHKRIGHKGHGKGALFYPTDLEIHRGRIYVADAYNHRIQVFDTSGAYVMAIGESDSMQVASGITVNDQWIAVTSQGNNRVLLYDHEGNEKQMLQERISYPTGVCFYRNQLYVANFEGNEIAIFQCQ